MPLWGNLQVRWYESRRRRFFDEPEGEVGRKILARAGRIAAEGAKRRALKRTGRMAEGIDYAVVKLDGKLVCVVYSGAVDPKTGFPYPVVHEGRHVRDRRPHRSLQPALKDIIGKMS